MASADDLSEVSSVAEGNIVVVSGLKVIRGRIFIDLKTCSSSSPAIENKKKGTITGDTIASGLHAMNSARKWLAKRNGIPEEEVAPVLAGVHVPDPVFFCSIEPSSMVCCESSCKISNKTNLFSNWFKKKL